MSNLVNAKMVAAINMKVREQIDRHLSVDPSTDPKKVVELTIRQETERQKLKLKRLLASDASADDDELRLLVLRSLIDDVLPELELVLKRRY
jgi:hypothetical protein